jgi:hypothetical protein
MGTLSSKTNRGAATTWVVVWQPGGYVIQESKPRPGRIFPKRVLSLG